MYNTLTSLQPTIIRNKNLFSLMHINCRSVPNKLCHRPIESLLNRPTLNIDLLTIIETWLDEQLAKSIIIPGYKVEYY